MTFLGYLLPVDTVYEQLLKFQEVNVKREFFYQRSLAQRLGEGLSPEKGISQTDNQ